MHPSAVVVRVVETRQVEEVELTVRCGNVASAVNRLTWLCGGEPGTVWYTYTKPLLGKFGSSVMPMRPRSPDESTDNDTNDGPRSSPFFTTRTLPPCSAMNTRPSGATASAVGLARSAVTTASTNPDRTGAALAVPPVTTTNVANAATTQNADGRRRIARAWHSVRRSGPSRSVIIDAVSGRLYDLRSSSRVRTPKPVPPALMSASSASAHAGPAMSRCAPGLAVGHERLEEQSATIVPAMRVPTFFMSATVESRSRLYASYSGSGQLGSPDAVPAACT